MGVYFDLGRPVVGGWLGGGWLLHDPVRDLDLLWGAELGQEGAWLFAIDVDSGQVVEEHPIGCREFNSTPDHTSGKLWVATNLEIFCNWSQITYLPEVIPLQRLAFGKKCIRILKPQCTSKNNAELVI